MENSAGKDNHDGSMDLPNRLHSILRSGEWSDCSFVVGTEPDVQEFKAHKLLLSLASPVFRAMFNGELAEKSPIRIVDIRPEIFQLVLDFIYMDQFIYQNIEQARDVSYAADKYMISKLIEVVEKRILKVLDPSNACQAYEIAKRFDRLDLMQRSLQIITGKTHLILKNDSFVMVQLSTILMLLDSEELNLTIPGVPGSYPQPTYVTKCAAELDLLNAVMAWGIAACKRKEVPEEMINVRKMIEPALKKVRFLNFSHAEFTNITQKWKVLTDDEIALICKNISPNITLPIMPPGFSPSRVGRKSQ